MSVPGVRTADRITEEFRERGITVHNSISGMLCLYDDAIDPLQQLADIKPACYLGERSSYLYDVRDVAEAIIKVGEARREHSGPVLPEEKPAPRLTEEEKRIALIVLKDAVADRFQLAMQNAEKCPSTAEVYRNRAEQIAAASAKINDMETSE